MKHLIVTAPILIFTVFLFSFGSALNDKNEGAANAFINFLAESAGVESIGDNSFSLYPYASRGCCKSDASFCEKQSQLAELYKQWLKEAENLNKTALKGFSNVQDINSMHTSSIHINNSLLEIERYSSHLVQILFERDFREEEEEQVMIDQKLYKIYWKNRKTIQEWTWDEFDANLQGFWNDSKNLSSVYGSVMYEIGSDALLKYLKWQSIRKILANGLGAQLSLTVLKNSKSQEDKRYRVLQAFQYYLMKLKKRRQYPVSNYYSPLMDIYKKFKNTTVKAFFDITRDFKKWNTSNQNEQCDKLRESVDKNHARLLVELKKLDQAKADMNKTNEKIKQIFNVSSAQLVDKEFHFVIEDIENLIKDEANQNSNLNRYAEELKKFREDITKAIEAKNIEKVTSLERNLALTLSNIGMHFRCLLKRAEKLSNVFDWCEGGKEDLKSIYESLKKHYSTECRYGGLTCRYNRRSKIFVRGVSEFARECKYGANGSPLPMLTYKKLERTVQLHAAKSYYYPQCELNFLHPERFCMVYCKYARKPSDGYLERNNIKEKYGLTTNEIKTICTLFFHNRKRKSRFIRLRMNDCSVN